MSPPRTAIHGNDLVRNERGKLDALMSRVNKKQAVVRLGDPSTNK